MEARARGEAIWTTHQEALDNLEAIPLDEGPGESLRRGTNLDKIRAPALTRPRLLALQRHKKNLARVKQFETKYGAHGWRVVDFEWHRQMEMVLKKIQQFLTDLDII